MKPLITLFLFFILISPNFAVAATSSSTASQPSTPASTDSFYATKPVISSEGVLTSGGFVPCSGEGCSACHFVVLANTIIKWLITMSFLVFAILALKAGFKLMTSGSNPSTLSAAKTSFTNALIGLIIILAAWLVVDTLLRGLLKGGTGEVSGYGPWSQVKCAEQTQATTNVFSEFGTGIEYEPGDPNDTTAYNGKPSSGDKCTAIPDSKLVVFPAAATNGDSEKALADTVTRFMSMRAAAARDGIDLKVSDGYRAPSEQLSAWNGNGCSLLASGRASCKTRTAAVPCSLGGQGSNHTLGTAVDIQMSAKVEVWLKANGGKFGFYNNLANDRPHWSSTGR